MESERETPSNERTLEELVHLALGTPEIGAVNFNILQTLLLSLLEKLNFQDVKAAVSPDQLPQITSTENDLFARKSSSLGDLDKKVSKLENQLLVLNSLPSNSEIIDKTKTPNGAATIWQHMQMQKKVENNEQGVTRALSLIDDILKEMQSLKDEQKKLSDEMKRLQNNIAKLNNMDEIESRLKALEENSGLAQTLQDDMEDFQKKLSSYPDASEFEYFITWPVMQEALSQHMNKMEELQEKTLKEKEKLDKKEPTADELVVEPVHDQKTSPSNSRLSSAKERFPEATDMLEKIGALSNRHTILEGRVDSVEDVLPTKADKSDLDGLGPVGPVEIPDDLLDQLNCLKEAIAALQNDKEKDSDAISRLQTTLLNLQAEMDKLARLIDSALEEHKVKQKHIDTLYNHTEKLSEVKADKEIVEKEIDVKADKLTVDRKVNRSDFDSTTSAISKSLDDLLSKFLGLEGDWQTALKKLASEVDGKLDRLELESLKQQLENRMKAMKKLLDKHQPQDIYAEGDDAAGFRRQLIQNYNCISCDRPVEMMPSGPVPSIPASGGLPSTRSVRPYTSFELDQIRQQAKGETEEIEYMMPTGRSCGGGYTLTYPHRRYTRLTHLSELWQDEEAVVDSAKHEVELQGHDGHIYKGRLPVLQLNQHMAGKGHTAADSVYDATYGVKKITPNRPGSARSPPRARPHSANRRALQSQERPRTAGRTPSHVTVATQDVHNSADPFIGNLTLTAATQ